MVTKMLKIIDLDNLLLFNPMARACGTDRVFQPCTAGL